MTSSPEYLADWKKANPEKVKAHRVSQRSNVRAAGRRFEATRREWFNAEKERRGCVDCGPDISWPAEVIDFDHVVGDKVKNVSVMKYGAMPALLEEMAKCETVCANHHRLRTKARRTYGG